MGYIEFNNHPKELKTTDCVVRSMSKAFDKGYLETRKELNRVKRELGFKSYKESKFIYKYLNNYERIILKAVKGQPRVRGYDFAEKYSKGTYILSMAGHLVTLVDGNIYDSWDSRYKVVYTAWNIV